MSTFKFVLELPSEPEPAVLLQVLKLLGVISPVAGGDAQVARPAVENPSTEIPVADEAPLLLGRDEAAARLNISTSTLDRWRKTGLLPVVKLPGAAPMFSEKALKQFVAENSKLSSPPQQRRPRRSDRAA